MTMHPRAYQCDDGRWVVADDGGWIPGIFATEAEALAFAAEYNQWWSDETYAALAHDWPIYTHTEEQRAAIRGKMLARIAELEAGR